MENNNYDQTKQNLHLKEFRELGIDINQLTYYECVDELINKFLTVSDALEYDEEERFRKELKRIQNPTN